MLLNNIANKIPTWWVAVFGTLLAVLSTVIFEIVVQSIDTRIRTNVGRTETVNQIVQTLRDDYKLSNRDAEMAGVYFALSSQVDEYQRPLVLWQARASFGNAITRLSFLTQEDSLPRNLEELRSGVERSMKQLIEGNSEAFQDISTFLNKLRAHSRIVKEKKDEEVRRLKRNYESSNSRRDLFRRLQVSFNILGLLIVLLKDLPIWKGTKRKLTCSPFCRLR